MISEFSLEALLKLMGDMEDFPGEKDELSALIEHEIERENEAELSENELDGIAAAAKPESKRRNTGHDH